MRNYSVILIAFAAVAFMSCKKNRSCSCSEAATRTTVHSNGDPNESYTTNYTEEEKYAKIKKDDLRRILNCNSRTETSTTSYTVPGGSETVTNMVVYDCKIK